MWKPDIKDRTIEQRIHGLEQCFGLMNKSYLYHLPRDVTGTSLVQRIEAIENLPVTRDGEKAEETTIRELAEKEGCYE